MLDELAVHNLGIIAEARLEPGPGFVVVTGETGAGKTMLLGALRLLVGEQARSELIGPVGAEARVDGRFVADDAEITVARRVGEGRSRAYLDGAMAPVRALVDRVRPLVEIVGQHDQLSLTNPAELRAMVDRGLSDRSVLDRYAAAWRELQDVEAARAELGGDRRALERELDLVGYQADEIAGAGFEPGDDAELQRRSVRLGNAESLQLALADAHRALEGGQEAVGDSLAALRRAAGVDDGLVDLAGRAEGLAAETAELLRDIRDTADDVEHDPEELAAVDARLTLLGDLRRKYGATLEEVLAYAEEAHARRVELQGLLSGAETIDRRHQEAVGAVQEAGASLAAARSESAAALASRAIEHLVELGMNEPVVEIEVGGAAPGPGGADRIELRFASDRRLTPGPVARTASGGELSRLVLSLRLAAGAGAAPVVAFDEIDAGVGGQTALAMGRKLAALAGDRQVLCVTHLPQVAAFADTHYVVRRDGTEASVMLVDGEQRLEELTRMLSGLPDSDQGRAHAEELRRLALAAADRQG